MSLKILAITLGHWKVNSYLISSGEDAFLIDSGDDYLKLSAFIKESGKTLKGILFTHGHFDHIGNAALIQSDYSVPTYLHSKDIRLANQVNLYRKLAGAKDLVKILKIDHKLDNIDKLIIGTDQIQIIPVPGHTKGSVAFIFNNCIFSGDLFNQTRIGLTDLPGGDFQIICKSTERIISEFTDYFVYPGHGQPYRLDNKVIAELKKEIYGYRN